MRGRLPDRSVPKVAVPEKLKRGRIGAGKIAMAGVVGSGGDDVFLPMGYEAGYSYPLIVWLDDPRGRRFDLGRVMQRVSLRNCVAVCPARGDQAIDREEAVWQAIDRLRERVSIHPGRIFLAGQGEGGTEAFRIACRHAADFAGVISLGGQFPHGEALFSRLSAIRQLPMLLCCRREAPDAVAQPTDRTLRLFHAAGALLTMRIYPGHNDLSKPILADVNRWIMDEICGSQTPSTTSTNRSRVQGGH
jgi:pimeloyl-ACP methyl ester carboxylesterase